MEESPSDGIQNFLTSDTTDISKHSPIEGLDTAQLSENQHLVVEITQTEEQHRINELDLTVVEYNGTFPYIINNRTFPKLVNCNRLITRRISWPCFKSEEIEAYGRNISENEIQTTKEEKNTNKIKGIQRNNSALTTKSIWGSNTSRFNNMLENESKFIRKLKYVPYMTTALIPRIENKFKTIENIKDSSKEIIQYAVFKPINLVINSEELKGVVKNSQDKDDVVMVLKSKNNNQFTNYWLTRIIKCTNRQEYEVVDHNTGEYSLLKLTKEKKLFQIYQKLFDQPHINMVEVLQLMTNTSNINRIIQEEKEVEEKIYYILLNTHEYITLDEYHINTIPSQINFKQIKEIIKGLINGLTYLHSKSMAIKKLTMKSVMLSKNIKKIKDKEDFKVKIVDLDEAKEIKGIEDVREDIKLIGNLLFNLIEGKKVEENHHFKSNLWNMEPKMYEFCIIALGKNIKFQSAVEALIHPWFTSKQ